MKVDNPIIFKNIALAVAMAIITPLSLADSMLEEVVVTAQKREQSIQEVPVAVTALTGEQLLESGITDVFDLQQNTPSLTVAQNQNSTTSNFSIRGVGTSGSNFGLESSVGLYIDGVYRARQSAMINEMVDMDRVEVLRGPQGTLFGRNSPSGAVLMYTEQPSHEFGGYINVSAGNYDLQSINGAIGGSLIDDVLAYRLTGFTTDRDGYVDDVNLGDEAINDRDRKGFRAQLLFTPSDEFSARLIIDHSEIDEVCCAAVTMRNNFAVFSRDNFSGQFSTTPSAGTDTLLSIPSFVNIPGLPVPMPGFGGTIIDQSAVHDDIVAFDQFPVSQNKDKGISLEMNWEVAGGTLTSVSGFRNFDSDDLVDADFSDVAIANRDDHAEQESFSQELRFSKAFDGGNFIVGAYYFEQDLDTESNTVMGADFNNFVALSVFGQASGVANLAAAAAAGGDFATAAALATQATYLGETGSAMVVGLENVPLTAGNPLAPLQMFGFTGIALPEGGNGRNVMKQNHEAWAIFGQLDYDISEELILTVGARYTDESKTIDGRFTQPGASWGLQLMLPDLTIFNARSDIKESLDDDQVTGNIKLSWLPSDDKMFYALYGTGYKSGGTNTDRISEAFSPIFDAETSETFELGMKADFPEQSLRTNITIHHTTTEDYQTNSFQGAGFNLSNAGKVVTKGLELELWWNPTDTLSITGAYIHNKGEFEGFDSANCWVATSWLTGRQDPGRANATDGFCNRSGDPIDSNAENTYMVGATQTFTVNDRVNGFVHANYNYRDEQYKDGNIDPLKLEDGYGVLNMKVGFRLESLQLEITAWARNLLDEDYMATYFDAPLQSGKLYAYPTEPRTYGLSLTKTF